MIEDVKFSQNDVGRMQAPMELDLVAFFNVVEDKIMKMLTEELKVKGDKFNPDTFIAKVEEVLNNGKQ